MSVVCIFNGFSCQCFDDVLDRHVSHIEIPQFLPQFVFHGQIAQTAHSIPYGVAFSAVTTIGSCDAKYVTQRICEGCMFGGILIWKDEVVWND